MKIQGTPLRGGPGAQVSATRFPQWKKEGEEEDRMPPDERLGQQHG
jgi:hypothetical protein